MGERISSFTAAVVNAPREIAGALDPIFSKHHIKAVSFQDVYHLTASIPRMSGNGESIVVISGLEEFEKEDFAVVKIVRQHFGNSCLICINGHGINGNLERVLQAVKLGIEIVTSAGMAEPVIARFKDDLQVKSDGNSADIPKAESFEKRMSGMMGSFFLTSAEQKALIKE